MKETKLNEVDKLELNILVDNYTDLFLLQSTNVLKRPAVPPPNCLLAEHGFSCLIKTSQGDKEYTVLMDMGITGTCLLHNADVLKVDLGKVEALVLSHGHFDHFWGLKQVLGRTRKPIPLFLHPEAFLPRRLNIAPLRMQVDLPALDEHALKESGVEVKKIKEDWILDSGILILGEVGRVTPFEKGFPWAEAKIENNWVKDPFFDDRGLAVLVKNKGLVLIGGCSHAGIVNTVKHAQKITGTEKVHAILGGFHLTGPIFEPIIGPTIEEIKGVKPDFVVPMHCTGWEAINQIAQAMPEQFLLNSVGTTYVFQG